MAVCMNKQKFPFLGQKYKNLYLGIRSQDSPAENEKLISNWYDSTTKAFSLVSIIQRV